MAQALYNGEEFSVWFEARAEESDYGVPGSPVWTEYTDIAIEAFEFLGLSWPIEQIPDNVYEKLLEYADDCEEWE